MVLTAWYALLGTHCLVLTAHACFKINTSFELKLQFPRRCLFSIYQYLRIIKVKVKVSRYKPGVAQRVGRGIALLFHDRGTRRGEWSAARLGRTLPSGKTQYPFYKRLGGLQGQSGRAENLVPTGIRSQTVHPVVSRYTD